MLKSNALPSQKLPKGSVDKYLENINQRRMKSSKERRKHHALREAKNVFGAEVEVINNTFEFELSPCTNETNHEDDLCLDEFHQEEQEINRR